MGRHVGLVSAALALPATACGGDTTAGADAGPPPIEAPAAAPFHYVAHLPQGEAQRDRLCNGDRDDRFTRWYCAGDTAPAIDGIETILAGVGIDVDEINDDQDQFAAVSHSTALDPLSATVLNPRVVFISGVTDAGFATVAFKRGQFVVELALRDLDEDTINFYLVMYRLSCLPDCTPAELRYIGYKPAAGRGAVAGSPSAA